MISLPVYAAFKSLAAFIMDNAIALAVVAVTCDISSTMAVIDSKFVDNDTKLMASTSAFFKTVFKPLINPRRVSRNDDNYSYVSNNYRWDYLV